MPLVNDGTCPHRLLYASLVDISLPYGPGVNERGFLKDMHRRLGPRLCAVIPTPSRGLPPDLAAVRLRFFAGRSSVRTVRGWAQVRTLGGLSLVAAVRECKPDLLVLRPGSMPLSLLMATRRCGVPYVLKTAGDATFRAFYKQGLLRRAVAGVNTAVFRRIVADAECIDVVSEAQREAMRALCPAQWASIYVIDNGVDIDQFVPGTELAMKEAMGFRRDDVVVGYVGNYPMQRGGKEVVDVVAAMRGRSPIKGLVVGDAGEAEALRRHARDRTAAGDVLIYGEAPFEKVPSLMRVMDIGFSILRPHEQSASEQKVRQYLATGLCVVGTRGSNEFLRGKAFARVVESESIDRISEAVGWFLERGPDGRADLGREARTFAETSLSLQARNDERLRLWGDIFSGDGNRGT